METNKKKKGLLATIWESMTKTGGCCGPGENCCGPSDDDDKRKRRLEQGSILSNKHYDRPSVFEPTNLLREARRQRAIPSGNVPEICVLDPDGDLFRHLRDSGAGNDPYWTCYHTELYAFAEVRDKPVVCFAHVTNEMATIENDFEKGETNGSKAFIELITAAKRAWRAQGRCLMSVTHCAKNIR